MTAPVGPSSYFSFPSPMTEETARVAFDQKTGTLGPMKAPIGSNLDQMTALSDRVGNLPLPKNNTNPAFLAKKPSPRSTWSATPLTTPGVQIPPPSTQNLVNSVRAAQNSL